MGNLGQLHISANFSFLVHFTLSAFKPYSNGLKAVFYSNFLEISALTDSLHYSSSMYILPSSYILIAENIASFLQLTSNSSAIFTKNIHAIFLQEIKCF